MEHGVAGGAQIVPDPTACAELWRVRDELIPVAKRYVPEFSVLEMGEVSSDGVAGALENLCRDRGRRQELSRAAFTLAQNPAWSWEQIARQLAAGAVPRKHKVSSRKIPSSYVSFSA